MKTRIDDQLRREARQFRLRFTCEDCAHFEVAESRCVEGYPNAEHRDSSLTGAEVLFCKLFEVA
jgi:hypothetical protein